MTRRFPIERHTAGSAQSGNDLVAIEEPLQLILDGKPLATLMRSPGNDLALAAGFLFSEGIIQSPAELLSLHAAQHPTSQEVHIELAKSAANRRGLARDFYLSSSCGVCGRSSIAGLADLLPELTPLNVTPEFLYTLLPKISASQPNFNQTGGMHAAALFNLDGELLGLQEDVGRHNALDKLIGDAFRLDQTPLSGKVLVMTSRGSFDIVQKAAMAGIAVVACMGAASSLAIDLAQSAGLALYWFLREDSVNGFADPEK